MPHRKRRLALAALFGVFIFALLPDVVVAVNDDFGYLRSVVETLQHGRPWTDDWLEPWSASLSGLSAMLFLLTHSFYFATYGLLSAFAAAAFLLLATLLRDRGTAENKAAALSFLILTSATFLWKELEFTSVALHVPALLCALYAAERRRWWLFLLAWTIALASRQSAAAWGILPLAAMAERGGTWRDRATPAGVILVGIAVFFALNAGMNRTHSQAVVTTSALSNLSAANLLFAFGVSAVVFLFAAGTAAFASASPHPRRIPLLRYLAASAIVAAAVLCRRYARGAIGIEHLCYDGWRGPAYFWTLSVLATAGWLLGGFRLSWRHAVYAGAAAALLATRAGVWDYYLIDVAVFGFFAAVPQAAPATPTAPGWLALGRRAAFGVILATHLSFVLQLKFDLDRGAALCRVAEHALREKKIAHTELSFAPFGFSAWYFYPYYITHEGATTPNIDGFGCYFRTGAIDVGQAYSQPLHLLPRFRHTPPSDRHALAASGDYRYAWFFRAQYFLLRAEPVRVGAPSAPLNAADYRATPYPLNDAEWRALVESR